jgi:hypothetical protein
MNKNIVLAAIVLGAGLVYCAYKLNEVLGGDKKLEKEERDITV